MRRYVARALIRALVLLGYTVAVSGCAVQRYCEEKPQVCATVGSLAVAVAIGATAASLEQPKHGTRIVANRAFCGGSTDIQECIR